jgi:hypothetical protein
MEKTNKAKPVKIDEDVLMTDETEQNSQDHKNSNKQFFYLKSHKQQNENSTGEKESYELMKNSKTSMKVNSDY